MAVGSFAMQQLRSAAEQAWDIRWQIASDMNGDGVVTIADVGLWIKWIFLAPGDLLVLFTLIYATPIALFFEISTANISGLQENEWVFSATSERWEHACEHLEPQIFLVA